MSKRFIAAALTVLFAWSLPAIAQATQITEVKSPGGITAWLVHEPRIPVISLSVEFMAGGLYDPPGKKGTANMASGLLDEGAGDMDALAFQQRLEDLAVSLSFDSGRDSFSGNLKTLSHNRDEAFEMLRLALTAPRFDQDAVERIRQQVLVGLKRAEKDPDTIANREWFRIAFRDHPYALPNDGTRDSVADITAEDLRAYVGNALAKSNMKIGVVGDISAEELAPLLDRTFGHLPDTPADVAVPVADLAGAGQIEVIQQAIPQSRVVFGTDGIRRNDPDWYAAYVLNYVLGGGGLTSRLSDEVREKRGLAYSVYSYLYPLERAAIHMGGVGTRNDAVGEALDVIRAELRRVHDEGITAEELEDAKTYLNGSFPLQLTSGGRIANLLVAIQRNDLGIDYIDRRPELIDAVTLEDVQRVAKRLLQPQNLLIVVVGNPAGVGKGG
jgi:zinc protease